MEVDTQVMKVEELYECMNIYRSVILYDDADAFELLKAAMIEKDYTFWSDACEGRIYAVDVSEWDGYDWCEGMGGHMDRDAVTLVICMGDACFDVGLELCYAKNFPNISGIFKI